MMADGTFVYGTLSTVKKVALFKDFQAAYGLKVILTRNLSDWCVSLQRNMLNSTLSLTTDVVQNNEGQKRQIHAIPGVPGRD